MDYFGINSADELPKISEVLMEEFERATAVKDILNEETLEEFIPTEVKDENHDGIIDPTFDAATEEAIDAVAETEEELVVLEEEVTVEAMETIEEKEMEEDTAGEDEAEQDSHEDNKKPEEEA